MNNKTYYIYILTNKKNWTLYVWITNNLIRRVYEHKKWLIEWFTNKYWIKTLVYYEETSDVNSALEREKYLKWKNRKFKLELIEKDNFNWVDLYDKIIE